MNMEQAGLSNGLNHIFILGNLELRLKSAAIRNFRGEPHPKGFALLTLGLSFQALEPGVYTIDQVQINNLSDHHDETYDIGLWKIEVLDTERFNDIEFGKKTLASNQLDWYRVELINNTKENIIIENIHIKINEKPNIDWAVAEDFNMTKPLPHNATLQSQEKKTFQFEFHRNNISDHKFISIRPILNYEVNGEQKLTILPTAIYSPTFSSDQILEMIAKETDEIREQK